MKKNNKWRINKEIRAKMVRVIGKDGTQIDVMPTVDALALAKKDELDLVEIAPKADPPVVKVIDFGKFKYQEEKKLKGQKKKTKTSDVKETRFSPFIAEGDFNTRMRRVNEFLKENNKVRIVVVFKGRHMDSKKFGYQLLDRVIDNLETDIVIDMEPKFLGRHLAMVISPVKNNKGEASMNAKKIIERKKVQKLKQ